MDFLRGNYFFVGKEFFGICMLLGYTEESKYIIYIYIYVYFYGFFA